MRITMDGTCSMIFRTFMLLDSIFSIFCFININFSYLVPIGSSPNYNKFLAVLSVPYVFRFLLSSLDLLPLFGSHSSRCLACAPPLLPFFLYRIPPDFPQWYVHYWRLARWWLHLKRCIAETFCKLSQFIFPLIRNINFEISVCHVICGLFYLV